MKKANRSSQNGPIVNKVVPPRANTSGPCLSDGWARAGGLADRHCCDMNGAGQLRGHSANVPAVACPDVLSRFCRCRGKYRLQGAGRVPFGRIDERISARLGSQTSVARTHSLRGNARRRQPAARICGDGQQSRRPQRLSISAGGNLVERSSGEANSRGDRGANRARPGRTPVTCSRTPFRCGPSTRFPSLCAILDGDSDPTVRQIAAPPRALGRLARSSLHRPFSACFSASGAFRSRRPASRQTPRRFSSAASRGWRRTCSVPIAPVGSASHQKPKRRRRENLIRTAFRTGDRAAQQPIRRRSVDLDVGTPASARAQTRASVSRRSGTVAQSRRRRRPR